MIALTGMGGKVFVLNAELIEVIEATPDTVISLSTGRKFMVREDVDTVIQLVRRYKQDIFCRWRDETPQG